MVSRGKIKLKSWENRLKRKPESDIKNQGQKRDGLEFPGPARDGCLSHRVCVVRCNRADLYGNIEPRRLSEVRSGSNGVDLGPASERRNAGAIRWFIFVLLWWPFSRKFSRHSRRTPGAGPLTPGFDQTGLDCLGCLPRTSL